MVKLTADAVPDGKKTKGKPRRRWRETLLQDISQTGVPDWKKILQKNVLWHYINHSRSAGMIGDIQSFLIPC